MIGKAKDKSIEERTFEEYISAVMELRVQLIKALNQEDIESSKTLAFEMRLILDAMEE